jgi:hypothetical protein
VDLALDLKWSITNKKQIHDWALKNAYAGEFNFTGFRDEQGVCGPRGCQIELL